MTTLARLDRKRKRKGSNKDWSHPFDPDARIAKMKDGRTHMAHKAEHAVDLETGAVVGVTLQPADRGDTQGIEKTIDETAEALAASFGDRDEGTAEPSTELMRELVADRGYHSGAVGAAVPETMTTSWYTTAGRLSADRATGVDTAVDLEAIDLEEGQTAADVYVVVRDLRGGQALAGPFTVPILR